ncbi:MAG: hypothetical protein JSW56_05135, partial [Deltaproteobacteria bacterium]
RPAVAIEICAKSLRRAGHRAPPSIGSHSGLPYRVGRGLAIVNGLRWRNTWIKQKERLIPST